jgi:hypothetical protein
MKNSYLVKPSESEQIAVVACQPSFVDVDASKNTYTTMSDYLPAVLKPTPFQKWLLLASIRVLRRFRDRKGSILMLNRAFHRQKHQYSGSEGILCLYTRRLHLHLDGEDSWTNGSKKLGPKV